MADVTLDAESPGFALFFSHLALEKALKAHVTRVTRTVPPRTHNLTYLSELAELDVTSDDAEFLKAMVQYCMSGRYDTEGAENVSLDRARDLVHRSRRYAEWLIQRL